MRTSKSQNVPFGLDTTRTLEINGTRQRVRLCGSHGGLPPLLIVQAGPGLPLLNEAAKFQQRLHLEQDFSVAYWDQRGCGQAPFKDTQDVSLETQIGDLCAIVHWLSDETRQRVLVMGISLGATMALHAAARDVSRMKAIVAVSIDTDTSTSDAAVFSFLQQLSTRPDNRRIARLLRKLGPPPYLAPRPLQLRARLLTDMGGIEHGKRFSELLRGLLYGLIRTYGLVGTVTTFRNMNAIQRRMLPELADLNLFADWPRPALPIHYIFGGADLLLTSSMVQRISGVITNGDTVVTLPDAGHMVHFDEPAVVRSIIIQAHSTS
jgi:pimeloyl-ACP methyl ester carboxylesterase